MTDSSASSESKGRLSWLKQGLREFFCFIGGSHIRMMTIRNGKLAFVCETCGGDW